MRTRGFQSHANPTYRCQTCAFGTDVDVIKFNYGGPYTNETLKRDPLQFVIVGNIFKCPNRMCDRQDLSFKEFYSKSCCNNIIENPSLEYNDSDIVDHDFLEKISRLHKKSGILRENAIVRFEESKKKMEEDEKELKDKEQEFQKIENQMAIYFSRTIMNITEGKSMSFYL